MLETAITLGYNQALRIFSSINCSLRNLFGSLVCGTHVVLKNKLFVRSRSLLIFLILDFNTFDVECFGKFACI